MSKISDCIKQTYLGLNFKGLKTDSGQITNCLQNQLRPD